MATINSIADGLWSAAGTWSAGVPAAGDTVNIAHTVTYDGHTAGGSATCTIINLNVNGILTFKADAHTCLRIANGGYIDLRGGHLRIGTVNAPIQPQYTAALWFKTQTSVAVTSPSDIRWGDATHSVHSTLSAVGSYNFNAAWDAAVSGGRFVTHLASTATAGATSLVLQDDLGLRPGGGDILALNYLDATSTSHFADRPFLVQTTAYDPATRTVTLATALPYTYQANQTWQYDSVSGATETLSCAVLNLKRNVTFGAEAGYYFVSSGSYRSFPQGVLYFQYVECVNLGQFGFTDMYAASSVIAFTDYHAEARFCSLYPLAKVGAACGGSSVGSRLFRCGGPLRLQDVLGYDATVAYSPPLGCEMLRVRLMGGSLALYHSYGITLTDCWLSNSSSTITIGSLGVFRRCYFLHTTYGVYPSNDNYFEGCRFYSNNNSTSQGWTGYRLNVFKACRWERNVTVVRNDSSLFAFRDCFLGPNAGTLVQHSAALPVNRFNCYFQNTNGAGNYDIYWRGAVGRKVTAAAGSIPAELFAGVPSGATELVELSPISFIRPWNYPLWEHKLKATAGEPLSVRIAAWAAGWTTPPGAAQVYLKLILPGTITTYTSLESLANNQWVTLTVSGTPQASGTATVEVHAFMPYEAPNRYCYFDFIQGAVADSLVLEDGRHKEGVSLVKQSTADDIAAAVWQHANGARLHDLLTGRWKVTGTQMVCYGPDGATPVRTFNLLDGQGRPTGRNPVERVPV